MKLTLTFLSILIAKEINNYLNNPCLVVNTFSSGVSPKFYQKSGACLHQDPQLKLFLGREDFIYMSVFKMWAGLNSNKERGPPQAAPFL